MPCIMCLATLAALGFATRVAIDDWLKSRLATIAENGGVTRETESVTTWKGEFRATLDDGAEKTVSATIHLFKDSDRIKIHIDDHSLTQSEAERLEDSILDALDAELIERAYPPGGPFQEGLHEHDEEDECEDEDEALDEVQRESERGQR